MSESIFNRRNFIKTAGLGVLGASCWMDVVSHAAAST